MNRMCLLLTIGLLCLPLLALAMGDGLIPGNDAPKAPKTNYSGAVTDRSLNRVRVTHMHCEGKTSVQAFMGEMRIKLTFDNIEKVEMGGGSQGFTTGSVTYRDGHTKQMRFKNLTRCYGESDLGQVMV